VIDTLTATVEVGEGNLQLRLLPPLGTPARARLDAVQARLRSAARAAEKSAAKALWRRFFLVRDAFASLGPAAVLTVHRSQGSTFGEVFVDADVFWPQDPLLRRQLVYVAVSRARTAVTLMAGRSPQDDLPIWEAWLREGEG